MFYIVRFSFILLLLLQVNLNAKEYAVVASFAYVNMPVNKIKALFLKKSAYVGELKIVPLNLSLGDAGRNSFEKNVLGMKFSTLKSYWSKQHYLGHRPPISLKSQKAMKAFIKNVHSAIGYIELKNVDSELNILYKWSDE